MPPKFGRCKKKKRKRNGERRFLGCQTAPHAPLQDKLVSATVTGTMAGTTVSCEQWLASEPSLQANPPKEPRAGLPWSEDAAYDDSAVLLQTDTGQCDAETLFNTTTSENSHLPHARCLPRQTFIMRRCLYWLGSKRCVRGKGSDCGDFTGTWQNKKELGKDFELGFQPSTQSGGHHLQPSGI